LGGTPSDEGVRGGIHIDADTQLITALHGEATDFVPVTSVTQTATLEQMKASGAAWPAAHTDPHKLYMLANTFRSLTGIPVIRIPFEITLEAEALGCALNMGKMDKTPYVNEPVGHLPDSVPRDATSLGRVSVILEALDLIEQKVPHDVPVVVGVTGPFTLAGHLAGIENLVKWTRTDPDTVQEYLTLATTFLNDYLESLGTRSVDVVSILEPSASTDMISPSAFKRFVMPMLKELADATETTKVLHICGDCTPILEYMAQSGYSGLSVESAVSVKKARRIVKESVSLVGNIDPVSVLLQGDHDTVAEATEKAILEGIDVVAPGCGLAPATPTENIVTMRKETERIVNEYQ